MTTAIAERESVVEVVPLRTTLDMAMQLGHFAEQIRELGGEPEWKYYRQERGIHDIENVDSAGEGKSRGSVT